MTMPDEMAADQLLEAMFAVVLDEARANRRFAEKLIEVLPLQVVVRIETGKRSAAKPAEPPVSLTRLMNREGEDVLRAFLTKRNKPQLLRIVERQQIPLTDGAVNGTNEGLREAIVEGVKFRIADRLAAAS
jgi:hypothetical protein